MRKTFDAELLELSRELTSMAATARDAIDLVTSLPVHCRRRWGQGHHRDDRFPGPAGTHY